ncbi:disulfide-isomerase [Verticillium alfalfae VaMs.102]|uniref:Protein disulfide-isomerase n=1 Tax=Verticillium alfalfae (strain VaMs.102 / ATCC MYA-4576 / FGSC 10136) TaxID=526221 RepID=C9SLW1_VERA1|nr:disulfide-isomerase [Verticillium alfalfae VaMs.102]EEY19776.1 disulfide-isomerase [Verticillium alfalfae VaMs.102]
MHCKRVAFGLLAAAAAVAAADDSDVTQLKKDTFDDFVKTNDLVLAEFFAPWCGHCKALAPEYEEAATSLKEKNIKLAKIDCTEEADLCQTYGTLVVVVVFLLLLLHLLLPKPGQRRRGTQLPAPRTASNPRLGGRLPALLELALDGLVGAECDAVGAKLFQDAPLLLLPSLPAVSLLTKDTLEEFKTADKVVLVAYIAADDKASNETFNKVAESLRDNYLFGGVNDAAVAEAEGVKAPAIVLYKSFDEGKTTFSDKFEVEAIEKFAKTSATPLIGEVGPETYSGYMEAGLPLAYIFAETAEEREELSKALKPIAEKQRGVINFATIDAKSFGAHAGNLNLQADKFPAFAIQETVKNQKFPFDQEKKITVEEITSFVDDFVAGKIEPSIKSEPIPETQEGPVTVVVAKNYEQIVLDDTKDVLIEFYAPWCGHCKALAPKYEELATLYSESEFKDKVVIAKVDATLNDVPDEIQGFPTIKLYPAGGKSEPVTYSGSRTIEDLIEFVRDNGKYKAEASKKEEVVAEESQAAPAATEGEAAKESDESHDEL